MLTTGCVFFSLYPQSYGADELFATSGAGRLLAMRQISKQPSETGGPAFQTQVSFQKQTSILQKQTSQVHIGSLSDSLSHAASYTMTYCIVLYAFNVLKFDATNVGYCCLNSDYCCLSIISFPHTYLLALGLGLLVTPSPLPPHRRLFRC